MGEALKNKQGELLGKSFAKHRRQRTILRNFSKKDESCAVTDYPEISESLLDVMGEMAVIVHISSILGRHG